MKKALALLLATAAFAGCSSTNPFITDGTGGTPGTPTTGTTDVPPELLFDLTKFTYDPAAGTLTVEGITLDETQVTTVYTRRPALDVPGYLAYTAQDDPLDRHSTAFVMQSAGGHVRGGVVSTGGQFNRYFAGTYFERTGGYTPPPITPTTGLVSYAGTYAGITNLRGPATDLLPVPPGTPVELIPTQAATVTGDVFINADFADNSVNGAIYNRVHTDAGGSAAMPSLALIATPINSEGVFFGTVEFAGEPLRTIGSYGGIFGGPNAQGVAGGVRLDEWSDAITDENEFGTFVLNQCGTPGDDPVICAAVNPDYTP